jgi:hypothetical protein
MKKKKKMTKPKRQQKIDVVLESLLNLERKVKELIDRVESLHNQVYYHPEKAVPKNPPLYPQLDPQQKYWPNTEPPFKYKDIIWMEHSTPVATIYY